MRTTISEATRLGVRALTAAGVPDAGARTQISVLVEADLRGQPSHGLLRLPRILERIAAGLTDPVTSGEHRWTSAALLEVDGRDGLGAVVAAQAVDEICERAEITGIACSAIRSSNHLGMLAWYVERVAHAGQLGVATTTSEALVHPWGVVSPRTGPTRSPSPYRPSQTPGPGHVDRADLDGQGARLRKPGVTP